MKTIYLNKYKKQKVFKCLFNSYKCIYILLFLYIYLYILMYSH